jgi:FMN phosphatase YigB (HAD superfamily)
MGETVALAFLLDVDNTLLNNDQAKEGINIEVQKILGPDGARRFWEAYEEVRAERGYVDFPATVSEVAPGCGGRETAEALMTMLDTFPFGRYLYPHALETVAYLATIGEPAIVSDGDPRFQRHKIDVSGITAAVDGRVLVVAHKELELEKVFARFPARHYVAVDDKPRIISALEQDCPSTFTTVLVEQGKYAAESEPGPVPDITVARIGDLRGIRREEFLRPHAPSGSAG